MFPCEGHRLNNISLLGKVNTIFSDQMCACRTVMDNGSEKCSADIFSASELCSAESSPKENVGTATLHGSFMSAAKITTAHGQPDALRVNLYL